MHKVKETELLAAIAEKMGYDLSEGVPEERFLREVVKVLVSEKEIEILKQYNA